MPITYTWTCLSHVRWSSFGKMLCASTGHGLEARQTSSQSHQQLACTHVSLSCMQMLIPGTVRWGVMMVAWGTAFTYISIVHWCDRYYGEDDGRKVQQQGQGKIWNNCSHIFPAGTPPQRTCVLQVVVHSSDTLICAFSVKLYSLLCTIRKGRNHYGGCGFLEC